MSQNLSLNKHTNIYKKNYQLIAGVDEVGRGPLVGSVIAGAVILPAKYKIKFLTDSKKLTEKQRVQAYNDIITQAISYAIGEANHLEIDSINILQASLLAMKKAVHGLNITPEILLVDGNKVPAELDVPAHAIIGGDLTEDVISAASIIAKVTRDEQMLQLHHLYPEYGFADHKGYPTKKHLAALKEYGPIAQHRASFAPVRMSLNTNLIDA